MFFSSSWRWDLGVCSKGHRLHQHLDVAGCCWCSLGQCTAEVEQAREGPPGDTGTHTGMAAVAGGNGAPGLSTHPRKIREASSPPGGWSAPERGHPGVMARGAAEIQDKSKSKDGTESSSTATVTLTTSSPIPTPTHPSTYSHSHPNSPLHPQSFIYPTIHPITFTHSSTL